MRTRPMLLIVLALAAGTVAAVAARAWLEQQRSAIAAAAANPPPGPPPRPEIEVLVAADALPPGRFVRPEHLRWQPWPEPGLHPSYLKKADGVLEGLVGAVARQPIAAGEPVSAARLIRPGERGFLAAMLTPGMRAVSLALTATTGNAGFVFPGDVVDIILTHATEQQAMGMATRHASQTVLRRVRVLAIDQRTDNPDGRPSLAKTATVEVDPKQAETIAVASAMGSLSFSLIGIVEPAATAGGAPRPPSFTRDSDVSAAMAGAKPSGGKAAPTQTVLVMRGGKSETVAFENGRPVDRDAARAPASGGIPALPAGLPALMGGRP